MRDYVIVANKSVDTIHLEIGKPRIRVTLDKSKWDVRYHMADSGSIVAILIVPKTQNVET